MELEAHFILQLQLKLRHLTYLHSYCGQLLMNIQAACSWEITALILHMRN